MPEEPLKSRLKSSPPSLPSRPFQGRRPRAPLRHSPPPSCGACPAPATATATQRRALPGAGAFRRGSRAARGARESPWRRVAGGEDAGGLQGVRSRGRKKGFGIPIRSPRWHAAHAGRSRAHRIDAHHGTILQNIRLSSMQAIHFTGIIRRTTDAFSSTVKALNIFIRYKAIS
jgi:hypothetical protein